MIAIGAAFAELFMPVTLSAMARIETSSVKAGYHHVYLSV